MPPREYFIVRDYSGCGATPAAAPRVVVAAPKIAAAAPKLAAAAPKLAPCTDEDSDDSLDGLIEARATSWHDGPQVTSPSAPSREFESDSEDDALIAEPTRRAAPRRRRTRAATADDDSEEEYDDDDDAPPPQNPPPRNPPPRKRRRTESDPRPRASFSSKYYGVYEHRGAFQAMYRTAAGASKWLGHFESEDDAAYVCDADIRDVDVPWTRVVATPRLEYS